MDRIVAVDPGDSTPAPTVDELLNAFRDAKPTTLAQIFWRVRDFRAQTWKTNKERMSRVIPIFRALIAQDSEDRFHRNHGELGFVLKDLEQPVWSEAEAELTEAIRIRHQLGQDELLYFRFYEFNRALCRIARGTMKVNGAGVPKPLRDGIVSDLKSAAVSQPLYL